MFFEHLLIFSQYDGADLVSLSSPPNTAIFDPAKRVAVLNPAGRALAKFTAPQTPVAATQQPNSIEALASLIKDIKGLVDHTPRTPTHRATTHDRGIASSSPNMASPVIPSPSQLTRFLKHAESKLGVQGASLYESPLRRQHFGPDILHRVPDTTFAEIGIHPGDVIRLKDGAVAWWKGPDTKRKRSLFELEPQDAPPAKVDTVAYERRFDDGGGCRFSGPPMVGGDPPNIPGETTWYRCEARKDWFPIPPGYTVEVEEGDDDNPFGP
jgi:hypothetical protein